MAKTKRIGFTAGIVALVALLVTLGFVIYNWPVHGIPPGWSVLNATRNGTGPAAASTRTPSMAAASWLPPRNTAT